MRRLAAALLLLCAPLAAQDDDPVTVSTDHPRLFLRPARLRLLKRERERSSPRWRQIDSLIAGNAPMPEPGFAFALHYQIEGDVGSGKQAIAWALGPGRDLRQTAIVYDWCQAMLTESQRRDLESRLLKGISDTASDLSVSAVRSRVMAAIALFDHVPDVPQRELQNAARSWWKEKIVAEMKAGRATIRREDAYALFELLHVFRDNTLLDLRESRPGFFKDFPIEHLLGHYPGIYQGPENDFHIPATHHPGEPDLKAAALSRAAELAMVAYDTNAAESQVLQGWLMHDRFMLRGTFGAPYEFLWANPYQPGLSYYHVPLVYHDAELGTLYVRSSWEESANWFGYFEGAGQVYEQGHVREVKPQAGAAPIPLQEAVVCFGGNFHVQPSEDEPVFVLGLAPRKSYDVEIDDEEMYEDAADPGGILQLDVPPSRESGVHIKPR